MSLHCSVNNEVLPRRSHVRTSCLSLSEAATPLFKGAIASSNCRQKEAMILLDLSIHFSFVAFQDAFTGAHLSLLLRSLLFVRT